MLVVLRRQQSPRSAQTSGEGFLLPGLAPWGSKAAGMLCQEWEGSEDRGSSAAWLVCCPSFLPRWPGPAPSRLSASTPRRALLPHTTGMRKKNEKTYQLTPLYQQSRNQDQVLPKTGGRKADREGRRH